MRLRACAAVLLAFACAAFARADARDDLAKEVHEEISERRITCVAEADDPCERFHEFRDGLCEQTTDALADYKAELSNADTRKRAVYRWWKWVSGPREQAECMNALIGKDAYCKAVNLAVQMDPHRNCPDAGETNSTCWLNRNFERSWHLFPREAEDWTQRCPVEQRKRMELEDAE